MKSRQGGFHISLRGIGGQLIDDIGLLAADDVFRECLWICGRDEIIALIYKPIECLALFLNRPDGVYAGFLPHLVNCLLAFGYEFDALQMGCRRWLSSDWLLGMFAFGEWGSITGLLADDCILLGFVMCRGDANVLFLLMQ